MQWPPTSPGTNLRKFHFVEAAFKTENVFISNLSKIIFNSLIKAILISLCVFSIILAASATLIFSALYVPAEIIFLYKLFIILVTFGVEPDIILQTFLIVCFLSPGLILSGL